MGKNIHYRIAPFETMSESGAHILRNRIERFWHERGVAVVVRVEQMLWSSPDGGGWVVRSNLVCGMPQTGPGSAQGGNLVGLGCLAPKSDRSRQRGLEGQKR